jgi:hypothetical protein
LDSKYRFSLKLASLIKKQQLHVPSYRVEIEVERFGETLGVWDPVLEQNTNSTSTRCARCVWTARFRVRNLSRFAGKRDQGIVFAIVDWKGRLNALVPAGEEFAEISCEF